MNSVKPSVTRPQGIDPTILSRKLMTALLFIITLVMSTYVIKTGNPVYMAAVVALPFALILMNAPRFMLVMALILNATMLPMPGMDSAKLGLLPQLLLLGTYFLGVLLGSQQFKHKPMPGGKLVIWYAVLLIVLMAFRGAGLRILGSTTWGGQKYIIHFLAIFMFFALPNFLLSKKHMRWIVWGGMFAGLIGSILAWKTGDRYSLSSNEVAQDRANYLTSFYYALLPVIFAYKAKQIKMVNVLLVLFAGFLIAKTGFRGSVIGFLAVIVLYGYFKAKNKIQYAVVLLALGAVLWGTIVVISPKLPLAIQRSISFIPGTTVQAEVAQTAGNSIEWRIEIWKYALSQAKQYLIIGRGMAFDVMTVLNEGGVSLHSHENIHLFMYQTHTYHSGPLALLIDLGIPGTIIYLLFSMIAVTTLWNHAKRLAGMDTFYTRFALFLCVSLIWKFISFYLIFGSVSQIGDQIMLYAVALLVVRSAFVIAEKQKVDLELP